MNSRKKVLIGSIMVSLAALESISASGRHSAEFLRRHESGDWGDAVSTQDRQSNEAAIAEGLSVASAYLLPSGETLWILTEAGGMVTRLVLGTEL